MEGKNIKKKSAVDAKSVKFCFPSREKKEYNRIKPKKKKAFRPYMEDEKSSALYWDKAFLKSGGTIKKGG